MAENFENCSRHNPNVEPRKKQRLSVSIIANVTAETLQSCASSCLKRSACRSFNYNLNATRYQCQLNEFDRENETQDDPSYLYSPISDWNPRLVLSCANHSCPEDSFCVPGVNQNYTCLQLNIVCRSPKRVENAEKITWPYPRKYKSEIKYNCKRGYQHVNGSSTSICQLNREWSEVSLHCSKISCGPPLIFSNATITAFNGTSVGDFAIYSCIKNAILKSSDNISVCSNDGNWIKPVECGFCTDNKIITYQGKQVCYKRSVSQLSYSALRQKNNILIATEKDVIRLFKDESIKERKNVFAGFSVNTTSVSFINGTTVSISAKWFGLQYCHNGVCVYNASGELTSLEASTEAYYYEIDKPN